MQVSIIEIFNLTLLSTKWFNQTSNNDTKPKNWTSAIIYDVSVYFWDVSLINIFIA